jgi:hypothetical protein
MTVTKTAAAIVIVFGIRRIGLEQFYSSPWVHFFKSRSASPEWAQNASMIAGWVRFVIASTAH